MNLIKSGKSAQTKGFVIVFIGILLVIGIIAYFFFIQNLNTSLEDSYSENNTDKNNNLNNSLSVKYVSYDVDECSRILFTCIDEYKPFSDNTGCGCKKEAEQKENIYCTPNQRNAQACIEIYQPVCGYVQVECITTPCNPVPETFSNNCFACSNERVSYYTEGACN